MFVSWFLGAEVAHANNDRSIWAGSPLILDAARRGDVRQPSEDRHTAPAVAYLPARTATPAGFLAGVILEPSPPFDRFDTVVASGSPAARWRHPSLPCACLLAQAADDT